jgi:hypothetical protein
MPTAFRHDSIRLHSGMKEEDFEKFMAKELLPFFSEQYKGPTRTSVADLKRQSLFKSARGSGEYLWVTDWEGTPESVGGASFEHARMIAIGATADMLKKLEAFGARKKERVFGMLVSVEVATNT